MKIFNNTNSIQIRDVRKMPFFKFKSEDIEKISNITKFIIKNKRLNFKYNFEAEQKEINSIIERYL